MVLLLGGLMLRAVLSRGGVKHGPVVPGRVCPQVPVAVSLTSAEQCSVGRWRLLGTNDWNSAAPLMGLLALDAYCAGDGEYGQRARAGTRLRLLRL